MAFFEYIETIFGNYFVVFLVILVSLVLKGWLASTLLQNKNENNSRSNQSLLLSLVLIGSMFEGLAWTIKLVELIFLPNMDYRIVRFFIRLAWGMAPIQYLALSLSIESLVDPEYKISLRQKFLFLSSSLFLVCFTYSAFVHINIGLTWLERTAQTVIPLYDIFFLMLPSLIIAMRKLKSNNLPSILKKQGSIFLRWIIGPLLVSDTLQAIPLFPYSSYYYPTYITNSFAITTLSTLLMTLSMYFCAQKMIGLRFLNFRNHVGTKPKFTFIDNFKEILQRLSHVTTLQELAHITQVFFKDALRIPFNKVELHIRAPQNANTTPGAVVIHTEALAETLLKTYPQEILNVLRNNPILIFDEIDFTNFYTKTNERTTILHFLKTLNADLFLPIFEGQEFIGYIVVERHARGNEFYDAIERDEMIVFASYLGNIIHLLKNKSLEVLIEQKQQLKDELYAKHKEIEQYKESMRSFLRTNNQQHVGVLYYQNRRFVYANAAAKKMVPVNINVHEGHPTTKIFKNLATLVETYNTPQTSYLKHSDGQTYVLSALPHLAKNMIIITISPPNVSDIIKQHVDMLKDPSEWDYLLYLETTKSGRLINQLIPGTGQSLLSFKIDLLKASLSTKAVLLDMPHTDLKSTVELLHHISLRETLHTMTLQSHVHDNSLAIQLFGINPLFNDGKKEQPQSLLEKLNNNGTLFIENIHFLDIETQNYLAEFIRYGVFRVFKSDRKLHSNTRIICSSDQNLAQLAQEGLFSRALFDELDHTTLVMPSLITLPDDELETLADGFSEQVLQNDTLDNLLSLNTHDKTKLASVRPASLTELKTKIRSILIAKSKKHDLYQETTFNPAYEVTDPDLMQAKILGRRALRDRRIMTKLWHKFKNQSDIALFLGVNRSSINRRCKEYNLQ